MDVQRGLANTNHESSTLSTAASQGGRTNSSVTMSVKNIMLRTSTELKELTEEIVELNKRLAGLNQRIIQFNKQAAALNQIIISAVVSQSTCNCKLLTFLSFIDCWNYCIFPEKMNFLLYPPFDTLSVLLKSFKKVKYLKGFNIGHIDC